MSNVKQNIQDLMEGWLVPWIWYRSSFQSLSWFVSSCFYHPWWLMHYNSMELFLPPNWTRVCPYEFHTLWMRGTPELSLLQKFCLIIRLKSALPLGQSHWHKGACQKDLLAFYLACLTCWSWCLINDGWFSTGQHMLKTTQGKVVCQGRSLLALER